MKRFVLGPLLFVAAVVSAASVDGDTISLPCGHHAAPGTVLAWSDYWSGELYFKVREGVGVIGVVAEGMKHDAVNMDSIWGTPGQNAGNVLAYFNVNGLPVGADSVGLVLPPGTDPWSVSFSYTPIGHGTVGSQLHWCPEPSTITMAVLGLGILGIAGSRRRAR